MRIRPFEPTEQNYETIVAIHNAINRDFPETAVQWRHWDESRDPKYKSQRYLYTVENGSDQIVATSFYMEPAWSYQPGKFYISIYVHPDYQNQGIGSQLYDHLAEQLAPFNPARLVAETRENRPNALHFLEKRLFERRMRYPISELAVPEFDPALFAGQLERVRASGIEIRTLAELSRFVPDWKQKAYDLEWAILADVPSPDQLTPNGLEQYEKELLANPSFMREGYFVALDGDQWVGMSNLWRNLVTDKRMSTGLTGVLRSHRRRSIATALKVTAIQFAQERGAEVIDTGNEENNPMLDLNVQLGFRPTPAFLDYAKALNDSESTDNERRKDNGHPGT